MRLAPRRLLTRLFAISIVLVSIFLAVPQKTQAVTGADWKPGRIIDDSIFFNNNSMTVSQIQAFLNAKVPVCAKDHAAYSTTYPPPYTCLKDYQENITTGESNIGRYNSDGTPYQVPDGKSAAQIIWDAGQAYTINPQTLIVMLQKEQSLVTDDWPLIIQYQKAMGQSCPDTAPCDPAFAGFYNQVSGAAWQIRHYINNPTWFNYRAGVTRYVLYNPNTDCGGTNVYIENNATAALYNYTPYQPNAGALSNLYGTASCGAYGNRNFWRLFNDWFGSTTTILDGVTMTNITQPYATPARGQSITYSFSLSSSRVSAVTLNAVGVVGRLGSLAGVNRDLGWIGPVTLEPGVPQTFTFTSTIRDIGTMYMWPAANYGGAYVHYNNWGTTVVSHAPNLTLSEPLIINAGTVYARQDVTFSAKLKNNEPHPINYDAIGIPVKFYGKYSYDAIWVGPGVIGQGAEVTLSGTRNIDKPGPYTYWVSNFFSGTYSTIGAVKSFSATEAAPSFSVSGITFSNTSPVKGENLEATSFKIKNNLPVPIDVGAVGIVGRLGTFTGPNRDLDWQGPIHFGAGEERTFSGYSRVITDIGTHYYWIGILYNGSYIQFNNWGSTVVSRTPSFTVSGITFSDTTPALGESLVASFIITNNLPGPIDVSAVGVVGRLGTFTGQNRDLGWQGPIHFNGFEQKEFTGVAGFSRTITDVGTHYYWIGILHQGAYIQYNNWGSTIVSH